MSTVNHQFRLASRPVGVPNRSVWNYTEEPLPEPKDGEVLVKVLYISLDPAMRGWISEAKSYVPPVAIGEVMRALGAGKVIASKFPGLAAGDYVGGIFGVQEYAVAPGKAVNKIDAPADKLPVYIGGLGMPGMTAYFGLLDVGRPEAGNMVVVSGAAGAVGSMVGQIAKIKGCTVIGIAGGAEKCAYLKEIGFDASIDYKAENVLAALRRHCPKGIDVYFDNVGGEILDAALANLALHARVVICGAISQYNNTTPIEGPANYLSLLVNRASMTGMLMVDYLARAGEARTAMAQWMKEGKLKTREHIVDGLSTFPETLLMLFSGENEGKLIIKVAGD
jgi:NADPH-dependent curcumin reductase CurA